MRLRWDSSWRSTSPEEALYAYAHPAPAGFENGDLARASARWDGELGLYVLDRDDVRASDDPHRFALELARSVFQHACLV